MERERRPNPEKDSETITYNLLRDIKRLVDAGNADEELVFLLNKTTSSLLEGRLPTSEETNRMKSILAMHSSRLSGEEVKGIEGKDEERLRHATDRCTGRWRASDKKGFLKCEACGIEYENTPDNQMAAVKDILLSLDLQNMQVLDEFDNKTDRYSGVLEDHQRRMEEVKKLEEEFDKKYPPKKDPETN